jgi:response regulator of citrate/malate metabolism
MIPVHALLLEDNRADATLVQRRLSQAQRLKFAVEVAEWLKTALTLLKNKSYDIIFVDLTLPDSNGIDTVMAIKRAAPNTPVIVLSGREDLETAANSVRAGAQSFIVKKPELTADELERDTLYALERARNELTSKELMRSSVKRLTMVEETGNSEDRITPSLPPASGLVVEHVDRTEETLGEVRAFLQKNYPAAAEAVDSILQSRNAFQTIRELRSLLCLDSAVSPKRTSKITDRALRAVVSASLRDEPTGMSRSAAENTLLEIIGPGPGEGKSDE